MNPAAVALTDAAARRLDHLLAEIGVIARHQPTPAPALTTRPAGPARDWVGTWYPDGNVPF